MDLNYLYQRYSISLHMADHAACNASRMVHHKLAKGYAVRIADARLIGSEALAG